MNEKKIYSVSQINNIFKNFIDGSGLFSNILVQGQLSNYKIYPSGHHYFSLKDEKSQLKCMMYKSSARSLKFKPENGVEVIVEGYVSVYQPYGEYRLYASNIYPKGLGSLELAYEKLKSELEKLGYFDESQKKKIPSFPQTIAVITSPAGAAVHDIIRVLNSRWPRTKVIILPVHVQGENASAEIADAINYTNRYNLADLIITGRGGGSMEDLWAFNEKNVATAIYNSKIPVISAVGHEPDVTISDYVADIRAATPSNAAEIAVKDQAEVTNFINHMELRLNHAVDKKIQLYSEIVSSYANRKVLTTPEYFTETISLQLDSLLQKLLHCIDNTISDNKKRLIRETTALDAMSPLKVLNRGYSIVEKKEMIIHSISQVCVGDNISVKIPDGSLYCTINEIKENSHES